MKQNLIHYAVIFAAAFGVTALSNYDHLFAAHGLDALKSAAIGLVIAGLKAGFDALKVALVKTPPPAVK
jgi:hypothetical protein